jgi:hypothetical protein
MEAPDNVILQQRRFFFLLINCGERIITSVQSGTELDMTWAVVAVRLT